MDSRRPFGITRLLLALGGLLSPVDTGATAQAVRIGGFEVSLPAGFERADPEAEKEQGSFLFGCVLDAARGTHLVIAASFETAAYKSAPERDALVERYVRSLRERHPGGFARSELDVAGRRAVQVRYVDDSDPGEIQTVYRFLPDDGRAIHFVLVFVPGREAPLPRPALAFLEGLRPAGTPAREPPPAASGPDLPVVPPVEPAPMLDINDLTRAQWAGAVSAAMESMRLVYGEMTPDDEKRFADRWAPLFDFPTEEAVEYLNRLNPLLGEFLALRTGLLRVSQQSDALWSEAQLAAGYDDEEGARAALEGAAQARRLLLSLQARMDQVVEAIRELGDPPDVAQGKEAARRRHRRAIADVERLGRPDADFPAGEWEGWMEFPEEDPNGVFRPWESDVAQIRRRTGIGELPSPESVRGYTQLFFVPTDKPEWGLTQNVAVFERNPHLRGLTSDFFSLFDTHYNWPPMTMGLEEGAYDLQRDEDSMTLEFRSGDRLLRWTYRRIDDAPEEPPPGYRPGDLAALAAVIQAADAAEGISAPSYMKDALRDRRDILAARAAFHQACRGFALSRRPSHEIRKAFEAAFLAALRRAAPEVLPPFARDRAEDLPGGPGPVEAGAGRAKEEEEERRKATEEAIGFHRANVKIIEQNLERDQEELAGEKDLARRAALQFRILQKRSDLMAEQDLIASIETGQLVHTRSPFDEYAREQFLDRVHRDARRLETVMKGFAAVDRLTRGLPADEAEALRREARARLGSDRIAKLDVDGVRTVLGDLHEKVRSRWEAEKARADADAAWADHCLTAAQAVKSGADVGMQVCSVFAGQGALMAYQGATGYIEGGITEAVTRAGRAYNLGTTVAVDAFKGFEMGGAGGDLGEAIRGAAWEGVKSYLTMRAIELGAAGLAGWFARGPKRGIDLDDLAPGRPAGAPRGLPGPDPLKRADFNRPLTPGELDAYRRRLAEGQDRVRQLEQAADALRKAERAGATKEQLGRLRGALEDTVTAVHASPAAKTIMKRLQKAPGNRGLIQAYDESLRGVHQRVEERFHKTMSARGWNRQKMREFRNSSNVGTVGMDHDIGLVEQSWFLPGATPRDKAVFNPWLTRKGKPAPVQHWQEDATQCWLEAYRRETGRGAGQSWETVTSSIHPEAYADASILRGTGEVKRIWAQQTADVTSFKGWHLRNDPDLLRMEKYIEIARGTAKDSRTKLLPMLRQVKPTKGSAARLHETTAHWETVTIWLDAMGSGKVDPITADRKIRMLTGGKSVPEVMEKLSGLMASVGSQTGR